MPNPYQLAQAAIQRLLRLRTSLPPNVSRTLGFPNVGGVPLAPSGNAIPNPGAVTRQAGAAGEVLEQIFNSILFGSAKPPVRVVTIDPLGGGSTFVPGSGPTPDRFTDVPQTIRGVTFAVDDALLVNGEANQVWNGHYTVVSITGGVMTIERSVGCQNGDITFAGTQVWDAENKVLYYLDCLNDLFQFTFGVDELKWEVLDVLNVAGTKTPARVATTGDLGAVYDATEVQGFTGAPAAIDGVNLANGDRVLVKDQAAGVENGVYTVVDAAAGTWERADDCRGEVEGGTLIYVQEGTANGETVFAISEDGTLRFGTDAITYTPYPAAGGIEAENAGVAVPGGPFDTVNFASGATAADGGGGTLDVTVSGGAPAPCEINTTAGKGPGIITVAAAEINDGATAFDEIFVPVSGGSGFGTALNIDNDPGGANAYKVGARVTLNISTGGVVADSSLDVNGVPGLSGLIGSNQLFQPLNDFGAGAALAANWHVILQYCGNDVWVLDGQMTGAFVI